MTNELIATTTIHEAGQVANQVAGNHVFADYLSRKSTNTIRAHKADLDAFCSFLEAAGVSCPSGEALQQAPVAWAGVTWGLVQAFVNWCLSQGVSIATVNRRLSTVKAYAALSTKCGVLERSELAMIKDVAGYSHKEKNRVDEKREVTRTGAKKATNTAIDQSEATALKAQPDSPQGRRDAVMMCLLLDHGLRVGELAALQVSDVDLKAGELKFWREKVQKQQRHKLTKDSLKALRAYMASDALAIGSLLRGSNKAGRLTDDAMSVRAINARVGILAEAVGLEGLSPHDCRHYWASRAIAKGTDPFALLQAGGWNSMTTVKRYVDDNEVANDGVIV